MGKTRLTKKLHEKRTGEEERKGVSGGALFDGDDALDFDDVGGSGVGIVGSGGVPVPTLNLSSSSSSSLSSSSASSYAVSKPQPAGNRTGSSSRWAKLKNVTKAASAFMGSSKNTGASAAAAAASAVVAAVEDTSTSGDIMRRDEDNWVVVVWQNNILAGVSRSSGRPAVKLRIRLGCPRDTPLTFGRALPKEKGKSTEEERANHRIIGNSGVLHRRQLRLTVVDHADLVGGSGGDGGGNGSGSGSSSSSGGSGGAGRKLAKRILAGIAQGAAQSIKGKFDPELDDDGDRVGTVIRDSLDRASGEGIAVLMDQLGETPIEYLGKSVARGQQRGLLDGEQVMVDPGGLEISMVSDVRGGESCLPLDRRCATRRRKDLIKQRAYSHHILINSPYCSSSHVAGTGGSGTGD